MLMLKYFYRVYRVYLSKIYWHFLRRRKFGANVLLGRSVNLGGNVSIGDHCYLGQYSYIGPGTQLGNFCIFSDQVNIVGGDHEFSNPGVPIILSGRPKNQRNTIIGDDVWLGHGVTVMRGCKIGNGSIVAANAVVTKDIESYAIYAGVPAKKIRNRFDENDLNQHEIFLKSYKDKKSKIPLVNFISH